MTEEERERIRCKLRDLAAEASFAAIERFYRLTAQLPLDEAWVWSVVGEYDPAIFSQPHIFVHISSRSLKIIERVTEGTAAIWPDLPPVSDVPPPPRPPRKREANCYDYPDEGNPFSLWASPEVHAQLLNWCDWPGRGYQLGPSVMANCAVGSQVLRRVIPGKWYDSPRRPAPRRERLLRLSQAAEHTGWVLSRHSEDEDTHFWLVLVDPKLAGWVADIRARLSSVGLRHFQAK